MYVNGAGIADIVIAPDVVQKLFPRKYLVWMGCQKIEQFQFFGRHLNALLIIIDRIICQIDYKIWIGDAFLGIAASSEATGSVAERRSTALMRATSSFVSKGFMI